jgi:hypothetical protein
MGDSGVGMILGHLSSISSTSGELVSFCWAQRFFTH